MSGRLHTKTATLTLLRDFSSQPEKLSEWFARGFRAAPQVNNHDSHQPESLSEVLKRLRRVLEQSAHASQQQEPQDRDRGYSQILKEIQKAGTVSTRELPEILHQPERSRPLSQEKITEHLFTDHESLARLRKAITNINTAEQNHNAQVMHNAFFSKHISSFLEKSLTSQEQNTTEISKDIKLSLLR